MIILLTALLSSIIANHLLFPPFSSLSSILSSPLSEFTSETELLILDLTSVQNVAYTQTILANTLTTMLLT